MRHQFLGAALAVLLAATSALSAHAAAPVDTNKSRAADDSVIGLIVKFDNAVPSAALASTQEARTAQNTQAAAVRAANVARAVQHGGVALNHQRTLPTGAEVLHFDKPLPSAEAQRIARAIASGSGVRYAAPNRTIRTQAVPTDPLFNAQWGFQYVPGSVEGANFTSAWDVTKGVSTQTIGVVDSGIAKAQEDIAPQLRTHALFPNGGYDFITSATVADDGDGRDNDPQQATSLCGHGTHVSGTIAANTTFSGTGVGVAGAASSSKLLMARALNFSGSDADAIDAMLWLAGETVSGVAVNPNPVKVINMSFGGSGACGGAYQDAFDTLRANGVVPVVAAGNSGLDVSGSAPANCHGAVAVAASDIDGNLASFSNRGAGVTVTAPGASIVSTGGTTAGACTLSGTSMAAPHVTGAVALMQVAQPTLSPTQAPLAIRAGARAFPSASNCPGLQCGAGLLDARGSLDVLTSSTSRIGWFESAATVLESDGSVSFTVSRIGNASQAITASVMATDGTAVSGIDFGAPSPATLSWGAGDSADKTVTLPIIHRSGEQPARDFTIALTNPSSGVAVVAPTSVSIHINDVDCNTVTPISVGQTLAGDLGIANTTYCHGGVRGAEYNTVRYTFTGTAGDVVGFDVRSTTPGPAVLDTYVYLLAANRTILAENDDIQSGILRDSRIVHFTLPTTGTYYIDVTTWSPTSDATGTYNIHLFGCGSYEPGPTCNLDVDGDGVVDGNDALLATRRMLGLAGVALTDNMSFASCASRSAPTAIATFVDAQMNTSNLPMALDIDGDDKVLPLTDGLIFLRAMLGLPATAVVNGATAPGGTRTSWTNVRAYLNTSCGLTLSP